MKDKIYIYPANFIFTWFINIKNNGDNKMIKEIKSVCKPEYNQILFRVKKTPGDKMFCRPSGSVYQPPFPEGYFMPKIKKQNPIVKFYKKIENLYENSYLRILFESFRK